MDITLIGWIALIISIYGFIKNEKILLYSAVFFSTFTATSFINIEKTTTGIQPFYLVAGLWILKAGIQYIKSGTSFKNITYEIKKNKLAKALIIFAIIIISGEVLMCIMNRSIIITDFNTKKEVVISFSKSNVTQSIYVLFMVLFATILTLKLESKKTLINIIKVFSVSSVFALVWGLIQFCMYYLEIEYPAYIFNNNISAMQAYMQVVYGIKRISSIALEPSTFALNILTFLPFIVILWLGNRTTDKSNKKFNVLLILIVIIAFICAILTTSSTAYIGLIISILILSLYVLKFSIKGQAIYKNKIKIYILYLAAFITTIILLVFITKIFEISWNELISMLKNMTIDKVNSESGHERGNAISMSLEIFKQVPILGAGWGSFRSLDMTTNLLANTGLIGLCSFIYIIYIPIKECILNRRINETISIALIFMILTPTIGLLISIPDLVFGYYWIAIVLGYSFWKKQN